MKKVVFFVLGFAVAIIVKAQPAKSNDGYFQVNHARGCAPLTVTITNFNLKPPADCNPTALCNIDFLGNKVYVLNQDNFIYRIPGTYRLTIVYNFGLSDYVDITVDPDIQPDFDVYTCSSSGVSIRITDGNYQQYFVDFGDSSPIVTVPASANQITQHSYASPGTFDIQVRGQKTNGAPNCTPKKKVFQAIAKLPPIPSLTQLRAVNESTIDLSFSSQTNILYRLEIAVNSITFQLYQPTVYGVNSFRATNLRLKDNFYCFRLDSYDMCTGGHIYSPVICSQKIGLSVQNGLNKVDWQTSNEDGSTSFDIVRNGVAYNPNMPINSTTFSDDLIECKQTYCYQVVANYPNGAKSFSLEECGTSFVRNIPTATANISSVVSGSQVSLTWDQDPLFTPKEYNVFKSVTHGTFFLEGKATAAQFIDDQYVSNQTCYKINYTDKCDNDSPQSIAACPLVLTNSLSPANEVTLRWSAYAGWALGVQNYRIEKFTANGSILTTFTTVSNILTDTEVDNSERLKPSPRMHSSEVLLHWRVKVNWLIL
ncbi:MAG: hypothetical protein ACKO13_16420, partial [Cytophagales bacterium]